MNQARRNYLHSVRVDGAPRYDEREPFACFFLCDTCGYLGREKRGCPACGGRHVIDLGHAPTFHALEDAQGRDRTLRRARLRRACGIGLVLAGLALAGAATAVSHSPGAWFAMGIVGVVAAGATMTAGGSPRVRSERRRGLAPKWRGPVVIAALEADRVLVAAGSARAVDCVRSPITGVPCLAHAVRVFDEDGTLLLEEHRNLGLELGGARVEEDRALVEGTFAHAMPGDRLDEVRRWLRARGIRFLEGMRMTEVVVSSGQTVELRMAGDVPVLAARAGIGAGIGYR